MSVSSWCNFVLFFDAVWNGGASYCFMFAVLVNNAYFYRKFGGKAMPHEVFIENIVEYLIIKSLSTTTSIPLKKRGLGISANPGECRLSDIFLPIYQMKKACNAKILVICAMHVVWQRRCWKVPVVNSLCALTFASKCTTQYHKNY